MANAHVHDDPGMPPAPPTDAGPLGTPPKASSWPTVIGIIVIVFGVLGMLGGVWTVASPWFLDAMMNAMPPGQPTGLETMKHSADWLVVSGMLAVALGAFLLIGGIAVLKRRARAARLCAIWAGLKMAFVVVNAGFALSMQQSQFRAMQQGSSTQPMPAGFTHIVSALSIAAAVLWGWALPVFLFLWFSRRRIKAEVAEWA